MLLFLPPYVILFFSQVLTKYSWVRRFCHVCIDLLLAGYYTYTILSRGYAG